MTKELTPEEIKEQLEQIKLAFNALNIGLNQLNQSMETLVKKQRFFIELVEECLPLDDNRKRIIHQKSMRGL